MRRRTLFALLSIAVLLAMSFVVTGCGGQKAESGGETPAGEQTSSPPSAETNPPASEDPMEGIGAEEIVMKTSKGTITFVLFPNEAPKHVEAFTRLVREGFYDGIKVHRVEQGFVVQAGDPLTKPLSSEEVVAKVAEQKTRPGQQGDLGTGGPGFNIPAEFNSRKHLEGTLAMARSQDPDSAGSQFYIALAPLPQLDGQYTVFGHTAEGMDVVKKLAVGDTIESATVQTRK